MPGRLSILALAAFTAAGCNTVAPEGAQTAATTSSAYVETIKQVNDLALDRSIAFSANLIPTLPRTESVLTEHTNAIRERAKLVGDAHAYFDGIAAYFSELDALAKANESEATAHALGGLADSLKKEPIGLKLSDEKRKALTGLAGYISTQMHAAAVEKALRRDADTVARALALTDQMLDEQIRWIELRERATRMKAYEEQVKKPFLSGSVLDEAWKKTWEAQVRTPPTIDLLKQAKEASIGMQRAWISVLRGDYSFSEILAALKRVQTGIDALAATKDAR